MASDPLKPPRSPISTKPRIMDFSASHGLAAGMKRVGGRRGFTRLGQRSPVASRHGKAIITHKY